jgi:hypothetical protein
MNLDKVRLVWSRSELLAASHYTPVSLSAEYCFRQDGTMERKSRVFEVV